jgi:hypothetical protein
MLWKTAPGSLFISTNPMCAIRGKKPRPVRARPFAIGRRCYAALYLNSPPATLWAQAAARTRT